LNEASAIFSNINWDLFDQATAPPPLITDLDKALSDFFIKHTMKEIFKAGQKFRIMVTPVNTPKEIMECPQLEVRQFWQKVNRSDWGDFYVGVCPPHVSTGSLGFIRHAPHLGEHNQEVYINELNLSSVELETFKKAGVI
jgi:crotonobetainyl-CoA:carnitine CoA-transferase CaiB-like acyl-CoA transferase